MKLPLAKPLSIEEYFKQNMDDEKHKEIGHRPTEDNAKYVENLATTQQPLQDIPQTEYATRFPISTLNSQSNINFYSISCTSSAPCVQMIQPAPFANLNQQSVDIASSNLATTHSSYNMTAPEIIRTCPVAPVLSQGSVLTNQDIAKPILPLPNVRVPIFNYTPFIFSSFHEVVAAANGTQENLDIAPKQTVENITNIPSTRSSDYATQNELTTREISDLTKKCDITYKDIDNEYTSNMENAEAIVNQEISFIANISSESLLSVGSEDIPPPTFDPCTMSEDVNTKINDNLTDTINKVAAGEGYLRQRFTPKAKRKRLSHFNKSSKDNISRGAARNKKSLNNLSASFDFSTEDFYSTHIENHYLLSRPTRGPMHATPGTSTQAPIKHYLLQTPPKGGIEDVISLDLFREKSGSNKKAICTGEKTNDTGNLSVSRQNKTNSQFDKKSLNKHIHKSVQETVESKSINKGKTKNLKETTKARLNLHGKSKDEVIDQNERESVKEEHLLKNERRKGKETVQSNTVNVKDYQKESLYDKANNKQVGTTYPVNIKPSFTKDLPQHANSEPKNQSEQVRNIFPNKNSLTMSSNLNDKQLNQVPAVVLEKIECTNSEQTVTLKPVKLVPLPKTSDDIVKENPESATYDITHQMKYQRADASLKKVVYIVDSQNLSTSGNKKKKVDKLHSPIINKNEKPSHVDKTAPITFAISQKKSDLYVVPKLKKKEQNSKSNKSIDHTIQQLNQVGEAVGLVKSFTSSKEDGVQSDKTVKNLNTDVLKKDHESILLTNPVPPRKSDTHQFSLNAIDNEHSKIHSDRKDKCSTTKTVAELLKTKRLSNQCLNTQEKAAQSKKQDDIQAKSSIPTGYPTKYIGLKIQNMIPRNSQNDLSRSDLQSNIETMTKGDTPLSANNVPRPVSTAFHDTVNTNVLKRNPVLDVEETSLQTSSGVSNVLLQSGPFSIKIADRIFVVRTNPITKKPSSVGQNKTTKLTLPAPRPKNCLVGKRGAPAVEPSVQIKKKVRRIVKKNKGPLDKLIKSLKLMPAKKKIKHIDKVFKQGTNLEFSTDAHETYETTIANENEACSILTSDQPLHSTVPFQNKGDSTNTSNESTTQKDITVYTSDTNKELLPIKELTDSQCTKIAITMLISKSCDGKYSYSIHKTKLNFMAKKHFEFRRWFKYSSYPCILNFLQGRRLGRLDIETVKPGLYLIAGATQPINSFNSQVPGQVSAVLAIYPPHIAMLPRSSEAIVIGHIKNIHDTREFPNIQSIGDIESMLNLLLGPKSNNDKCAFVDERYKSISDEDMSPKCHSPSFYSHDGQSFFSGGEMQQGQFESENNQTNHLSVQSGSNDLVDSNSFVRFSERAIALKMKQNRLLESCRKLKQHKTTNS